MKHTHAAKDYTNRSHNETETVFTKYNSVNCFNLKFNRNFNFNYKIEARTPDAGSTQPKHVVNKD
jgi:hypothetical protein